MRLITWNINSVRLRIELLARLVEETKPDIVCLQETKVEDALFPGKRIAEMGLPHQAIWGQKSYNGVAILARQPVSDIQRFDRAGKSDCRHVAATVEGIGIHCLYIPSGGDVPDPSVNEKFAHKLAFVEELTTWGPTATKPSEPVIWCGDFNIAPLEHDVWSHKELLDVVSHTPVEVEALTRMQASLGWIDVARHFVPASQKLYSWWSYRAKDWETSDRGRRLDHVWATPALGQKLKHHEVVRDARGWTQASDHAPVIVDFA